MLYRVLKGDKFLPSNYRHVTLLNCLGKLRERIVFKNLYTYFIDNNLLYKSQSRFLPHHSAVFKLIEKNNIIITKPFTITCFPVLISVMCLKLLIESGIWVCYLS